MSKYCIGLRIPLDRKLNKPESCGIQWAAGLVWYINVSH